MESLCIIETEFRLKLLEFIKDLYNQSYDEHLIIAYIYIDNEKIKTSALMDFCIQYVMQDGMKIKNRCTDIFLKNMSFSKLSKKIAPVIKTLWIDMEPSDHGKCWEWIDLLHGFVKRYQDKKLENASKVH